MEDNYAELEALRRLLKQKDETILDLKTKLAQAMNGLDEAVKLAKNLNEVGADSHFEGQL